MIPPASPAARRRSVELLAQALYEASDPAGTPWARRTRIVREAWLALAEKQISEGGEQSAPPDEPA